MVMPELLPFDGDASTLSHSAFRIPHFHDEAIGVCLGLDLDLGLGRKGREGKGREREREREKGKGK